jgi:hypothetical protein
VADGIPGVDDLRRKSEVGAAAAAYLADEDAKAFALKSGRTIDVAKASGMRPQAKNHQTEEATTPGLRRAMMKTAVVTFDEALPARGEGRPVR